MKNKIIIGLLVLIISSCAAKQDIKPCLNDHTYGFFGGLWHGIISPVSFIGSLFSDDITVWAVNNNGGWYTFGFLLGVGALTGGSSTTASKRH